MCMGWKRMTHVEVDGTAVIGVDVDSSQVVPIMDGS